MTLKQILKGMPKLEVAPMSDEYVSGLVNKAMDEWFRYCTLCKKKLKNHLGVILHTAKKHRQTYLLAQRMRKSRPNPYVEVHWDSQ